MSLLAILGLIVLVGIGYEVYKRLKGKAVTAQTVAATAQAVVNEDVAKVQTLVAEVKKEI